MLSPSRSEICGRGFPQKWNYFKEIIFYLTIAEHILPRVLQALCSPDTPPGQHLETQQALVKQLAEILEFTLKFDELKVRYGISR